jgi:membrane-bound lytic murein transglycosylase D
MSVNIQRDIDVALAASLAGLPLAEFQMLNPQHNKPVILAAGTPQVLLPYDNAARFVQALSEVRRPLASWTAWVAPRTLKPAEAARLVGMSEAALRDVNRIPPRMRVRAGSTLLVPRAAHTTADVAEHIADNGMIAFAPEVRPNRRVAFKAGRKGDTLAAVARRHGVAPATVARLNKLPVGARFAPGQAVVLNLPPAREARTRVASRASEAGAGKTRQVAKAPAPRAKAKVPAKRTAQAGGEAGKRVRVAQR